MAVDKFCVTAKNIYQMSMEVSLIDSPTWTTSSTMRFPEMNSKPTGDLLKNQVGQIPWCPFVGQTRFSLGLERATEAYRLEQTQTA